jgi:hypothetical protein
MKWVLIVLGALAALIVVMALIGAFLPRDHRATSTITLRQPVDSVWKALQEIGTGGIDVPIIVIESSPPRRMVTQIDPKAKEPFGGTWTFELTPEAGSTRVTVTEAGWISNTIFRFLACFLFGYYLSLDKYLKALSARLGETARPTHG